MLGAVFSSALVASASVVPKATPRTSTNVKPDLAFYAGKTITLVDAGAAGNGPGLVETSLAPVLAAYLHATVNVEYFPQNTNVGLDAMAAATPDGLTLGWAAFGSIFNDFYANILPINFSLKKLVSGGDIVVGAHQGTDVLVSCANSGITNIRQVVQTTSPLTFLQTTAPALGNQFTGLLRAAYAIPNKVISGYTATTLPAGCQRGDGPLAGNNVSLFSNAAGTALPPGEQAILYASGGIPSYSPYKWLKNTGVTSIQQLAKQIPPKTPFEKRAMKILLATFSTSTPVAAFIVPLGTPQKRVTALRAAFNAIQKNPAVLSGLDLAGYPHGWIQPPAIATFVKSQIREEPIVQRALGYPVS